MQRGVIICNDNFFPRLERFYVKNLTSVYHLQFLIKIAFKKVNNICHEIIVMFYVGDGNFQ